MADRLELITSASQSEVLPGRDVCVTPARLGLARPTKAIDANGQSLAYVYSRDTSNDAHIAKVLTEDEARRIARNIAKLPSLLQRS